jgi:hypothetical protein
MYILCVPFFQRTSATPCHSLDMDSNMHLYVSMSDAITFNSCQELSLDCVGIDVTRHGRRGDVTLYAITNTTENVTFNDELLL